MIYEFKSRATGNVVTTQAVAERILRIIGKPLQPKGVILPEQMPAALDALARAIENERNSGASPAPESAVSSQANADTENVEPEVSLASRSFPFQEMLRQAYAARKEITWGV